jgi:triphosphoribosyl-dephospho-CoA synthase
MEVTPADRDSDDLSIGQLASIACLLEVSAAKPGNVHRLADFEDMTFQDFQLSAVAVGPVLDRACSEGVGAAVLGAIEATSRVTSANTNLGLVLLLAPLAAVPRDESLSEGIAGLLEKLTAEDTSRVYRAIQLAQPGGLGEVDDMDINDEPPQQLLPAMQQARERDMIARQYSDNFQDLLHQFLPWLIEELSSKRPTMESIVRLHLRIMAGYPDSLIARKCGREVACQAASLAEQVLACEDGRRYEEKLADLDFWLRSDHHERNPGTTADLVGATLFAALREGHLRVPLDALDLAGVV